MESYKFVLCSRLPSVANFPRMSCALSLSLRRQTHFPNGNRFELVLRLIEIFMHRLRTQECLIADFSDTSENTSFFFTSLCFESFRSTFFLLFTFNFPNKAKFTEHRVHTFRLCLLFLPSFVYRVITLLKQFSSCANTRAFISKYTTALIHNSTFHYFHKNAFESFPLLIEMFSLQLILISF